MLRRLLPVCALALALFFVASASSAADCPSPEKKGQTPGGYTICKPSAAAQCGPGRKYTKHPRELVPMCEDAAPAVKSAGPAAPAAKSACAPGETFEKYRGYDVCKPNGGACGKGRRNVPHHRFPDLIVCEKDPHASSAAHVEITCAENERPYFPKSKTGKPFCEPVGRCGFGRVAVAADVPGKKMCIPK